MLNVVKNVFLTLNSHNIRKGLQIGFDDLVQGVARLNTTEVTTFFEKLNHTISGQQSRSTLREEAILLKQIKAIIPASVV